MKIHPMFCVSLLNPYRQSQLTCKDRVLSDMQEIERVVTDEEFEVEEILGSQEREEEGIPYLVKWMYIQRRRPLSSCGNRQKR